MSCPSCPLLGDKEMKFDCAVNIKVDERMSSYLGKICGVIDCTQSEFIRCCIYLASPQIERNPDLIRILPFQNSSVNQAIIKQM